MTEGRKWTIGDRARIGGEHPWAGHHGTIVERISVHGWAVELDGEEGRRAGVHEWDLLLPTR